MNRHNFRNVLIYNVFKIDTTLYLTWRKIRDIRYCETWHYKNMASQKKKKLIDRFHKEQNRKLPTNEFKVVQFVLNFMWPNSHIKLYLTQWDFRLRGLLANALSLITNVSALLLVKISCNTSNRSLETGLSHPLYFRCLLCSWPAHYAISYLLPVSSLGKQRMAHSRGKYNPSLQNIQWQIWLMANAFHVYTANIFQKDIVVDSVHSQNYINKALVTPDEVGFTIHIPFEQLKSWYETKKATLVEYTYVQVLNGFIGKKSLFKIQENCSRVEECLRLNCTRVAKQFLGKNGRRRQNLLPKSKSIAIHQGEFRTGGSVALLGDLEYHISRLENINTTITQDNKNLNLRYKGTSTLFS